MHLIFNLKTLGGGAVSFLVGVFLTTYFSSSDIIQALKFLEQNNLIPEEFEGENRLFTKTSPPDDSLEKNKKEGKKIQNKNKKDKHLKKPETLKTFPLNSQIFTYVEKRHIPFIGNMMYFFLSLFVFTLMKQRAKKTLEEKYQAKLRSLTKKFCKLEREKKEVHAYGVALKNYEKEKITILEKIFPAHNKVSNVIQEFYSYCSKEVTDNFKVWTKTQEEKDQKCFISVRSILKEIKNSFSHKIISQQISFKIRGKDIFLKGVVPSIYFIFYYTFKKIIETIPKEGRIEIILIMHDLTPRILIKDNGYAFSEDKMKDFKTLLNEYKQEFPESPTYEDIKQIGRICRWDIKEVVREGDFNTTEIIIHKEKNETTVNQSKVIDFRKFQRRKPREVLL